MTNEMYTDKVKSFRENYDRGNFDEAMKNALDLDSLLYEEGKDLLKLS